MYKLLLVSDDECVLNAFEAVGNWEMLGFKPPHIRHDFEGMKDSFSKHHADGIAIAVSQEEENRIVAYLRDNYPLLPIFGAGRTREEVIAYLKELKSLLNRLRADFSNDRYSETDMLQLCRHEFLAKVMAGGYTDEATVRRYLRLLRSRMDPDSPCVVMELEQAAVREGRLEGRWISSRDRLELELRNSFGPDAEGLHIAPTVHPDGRILVLVCPFRGRQSSLSTDEMTAMISHRAAESIAHLRKYKGLDLHIVGIRVQPSLIALCGSTVSE